MHAGAGTDVYAVPNTRGREVKETQEGFANIPGTYARAMTVATESEDLYITLKPEMAHQPPEPGIHLRNFRLAGGRFVRRSRRGSLHLPRRRSGRARLGSRHVRRQ